MLLQVKNLHFSYTPNKKLFNNLSISIDEGQIIALAGESGCGKSTLLNLIYGLLDWEDGQILLNGTSLMGPKGNLVPGEKDMKFVAQTYDLMPYSTVSENVGKFISNINLNEKKTRVHELLKVVGMEDFADIKPQFLSGGQQQRVAIARALSVLPKLLLLDEPFSNLDFSRKIELRERLFNFVKQNNLSLIISTHEIQEVMPWLDRITVLQDGRLIQNDSPKETYLNPYNSYVAKLFGEVNVLSDAEKDSLKLSRHLWYPHQIKVAAEGEPAKVLESRFSGSYYWNRVMIDSIPLVIYTDHALSGTVNLHFTEQSERL